MDSKTLFIGALPPFFAILAELVNPVSEEVIRKQLSPSANPGKDSEAVENHAELVAAIANGAVKISLLIPTWISVTAGLSAVLIESVNSEWSVGGIAIWTALWAIFGLKYFSNIDYYKTGLYEGNYLSVSRATGVSFVIIGLNAAVIVIILAAALRFPVWFWPAPP